MSNELQETSSQVPSHWVNNNTPYGTENCEDYADRPYIRVVQKTSREELVAQFGAGTAILEESGVGLARFEGESFTAVPVYAWREFSKLRDPRDTADGFVVDRTFDPVSEIAHKASDWSTRFEAYPGDDSKHYQFIEALNFALVIESGEGVGKVCVASFAKGSRKIGVALSRHVNRFAAEPNRLAIYAHRLEMFVGKRTNKQGQAWFVLDWKQASEPFTSEDDVARYHELYEQLASSYRAGLQHDQAS